MNWKLLFVFGCFGFVNSNANSQWIQSLPSSTGESILWSADHEEGDLSDWTFPASKDAGGGVLNTGEEDVHASATKEFAHSRSYSARAFISNAIRSRNGSRAVRLMRWTDRPWDRDGKEFPVEAYYSTCMFIPKVYNPNKYPPWDSGDGGWWNVFQFKAHDENDVSQPMWTLNIQHDDKSKEMSFYMSSPNNPPRSFSQKKPKPIPLQRWFHIEARCKKSWKNKGSMTIWQDGEMILDVSGIQTMTSNKHDQVVWGIGSYTDHIAGGAVEGEATVYFDDSIVSTKPLSPFVFSKVNPQLNRPNTVKVAK